MFEVEWTVSYALSVTDGEMDEMVEFAQNAMDEFEMELEDAVHEAVQDYLSGQDDEIFYCITSEATAALENALMERFADADDDDPRCIPTIMELNP